MFGYMDRMFWPMGSVFLSIGQMFWPASSSGLTTSRAALRAIGIFFLLQPGWSVFSSMGQMSLHGFCIQGCSRDRGPLVCFAEWRGCFCLWGVCFGPVWGKCFGLVLDHDLGTLSSMERLVGMVSVFGTENVVCKTTWGICILFWVSSFTLQY
jgi:hypothetical protein